MKLDTDLVVSLTAMIVGLASCPRRVKSETVVRERL
jgi:hypothetical protein